MRSVSTLVALIALRGVVAVARVHTQLPPPAPAGPPAGPGAWAEKTHTEPRAEVASAFANGKLYVFGGLARGLEASTLTQEWDPATDKWCDRAPMPAPLSHPNAFVMNGTGFNPRTGKWTTYASMTMGKHAVSAATDGDTVYLTGGSPICGLAYTDSLMTFRVP